MNRWLLYGLVVVVALVLARCAFMSFANTRSTSLTLHVPGTVDELTLYEKSAPDTPITTIDTLGKDVSQTVELANRTGFSLFTEMPPAAYYYVLKKGAESRTVTLGGFETFQSSDTLTVSDTSAAAQ